MLAFSVFPALAAAQGSDTIYDDVDERTEPREQNVQQASDAAQEEAGQPLYAFLVPNAGVDETAQRELLLFEALDNDYMYMDDPSAGLDGGSGDDWGGGDFGGGGDFQAPR